MKTQNHTYNNTYGENVVSFGKTFDGKFYVEVTNEIKIVSIDTYETEKEAQKRFNVIKRR